MLVKSWPLALPHLLIVAALTGNSWSWDPRWGATAAREWESRQSAGVSLLTILVLVAAVILLFTRTYRRTLFNLILGLNRWIYRVIAYVALMRDEYPPFRLDQGPVDQPLPGPGLPPETAAGSARPLTG
ncbi:DUF4389 domain-containing protein [Arthrobacter sp. Br18]|uniref:DUF4389 domain-containing protein n=1 Tax=Arthrobacter sp. Br18 TaxID=1312954 RepID=UPI0004B9668A|nr:DUF4389 domain-containing protein [Arthrobacter sp. Br18]